jgi:DNA-binding NtrC family response regulator/tetratricopeptide (TPR) repeat protein
MDQLEQVSVLQQQGRFAEALTLVESARVTYQDRQEAEVLRCELSERLGRYALARGIAERIISLNGLAPARRARCECILGLIDTDEGNTDRAQMHFQRSIAAAHTAKNLHLSCVSQLRLVVLLADKSGHLAVAPLLSQVRADVTRLGNAVVSATLHILMGAMETRRGLLVNGVRHTRLGLRLLGEHEDLWLAAVAENTLVAAALMRSDIAGGIEIARSALEKAERSGAAAMRRATLANLGNLLHRQGHYETALTCFEKARAILATCGERDNATLDSMALSLLAQGRIDDAVQTLQTIDQGVSTPADWLLYGNRHSRLTRTLVLLRHGRVNEALVEANNVLKMSAAVGDHFLHDAACILRADIFRRLARTDDFLRALEEIVPSLQTGEPRLYARYLELLICEFSLRSDGGYAEQLLRRARQIYTVLQDIPGKAALDEKWNEVTKSRNQSRCPTRSRDRSHLLFLQNVAALLLHAGRPELVATGLVAILEDAGAIVSAAAVSRGSDESLETLAAFGAPGEADAALSERVFAIGTARGRAVEVRIQLRTDIESIAAVNAVTLLLGTIRDLERAHAEREERLTLWPLEEVPQDGDQTVVLGQLSEVMSIARKVAAVNVNVLITGESGTGKEILARAVHRYSARVDKPFVPFNCAAIPREMLESQLFGHRRGAFTGADRDNPGVIRAARDGTLFLDEIGELSIELQPKLLRFLESGEISPLGDPTLQTVDVRILAATNANLEQLVQQGRFREDLFYRLNVIRLSVPPLRERRDEIPALVHHFVGRAAQEFGKARVRLALETMEHLIVYPWPGNVRQLNNELRRMVALAESDTVLGPSALSKEILRATPRIPRGSGDPEISVPLGEKLLPTLSRVEREMIKAALKTNEGKVEAAARALGISRKGLYLKRQRLGL